MQVILIILCTFTSTVESVFKKQYSLKVSGGNWFFNAQASLFALLFFCVTAGKISFSAAVLPYSVAFAATYITASVAMFIAIKTGSLAITSLIGSYSLIIPTFYGFFFLNEKITLFKVFGIAFLLISLFEIRADSREKINKPTAKWIISVITGFIANGMCAVIQNAQQRKFSGAQNSNFMILALLISFAVLLILALIFESGKIVEAIKKGGVFGAACGLCNGATNLLVMVIIASVASSVFFPVLSAAGLVLTFIISVLIYKEKFIPRQIAGLACGLVSLVLLNL